MNYTRDQIEALVDEPNVPLWKMRDREAIALEQIHLQEALERELEIICEGRHLNYKPNFNYHDN